MNKFDAAVFVNLGSSLNWFGALPSNESWTEDLRKIGESFAGHMHKDLESIGCNVAAQAARRFGNDLPWPGISPNIEERLRDIKPRSRELQSVIFDEMKRHLFFWVPPERARFYELPEDVSEWNETEQAIDELIGVHFKRAATEILQARKSYAVGQYTASVFHLMRACEVGIKALYKSLGISAPKLSDSWGNLLKPMDEQIKLGPTSRHGDWGKLPSFFDHATNDVRAIKRSWRDTTMHIDSDYNEGQALKALDAVTSFFVHLSEHLNQDGATH